MNLEDLDITENPTISLLDDFGVTDLDLDLQPGDDLVFDFQEVEEELSFDLGSEEEEEALSAATLLDAKIDMVQTLTPYASEARKALGIFEVSVPTAEEDAFLLRLSQSEFPFVPPDVFAVLQSIVVDALRGDANHDAETACTHAIEFLKEATGWAPGVYREDFEQAFTKWWERLKPVAKLSTASQKTRLAALSNEKAVQSALQLFRVNTGAFVEINNLFADAAVRGSTDRLSLDNYLVKTVEYMHAQGLRSFRVKDAYEFIAGYFASDEIEALLKISPDERISFSTGELVRRLALVELQEGLVDQTGFRNVDCSSAGGVLGGSLQCLTEMSAQGSVVAEMICLTAMCILAMRAPSKGESTPTELFVFLSGVTEFYQASLEHESLVNPIFYSRVTENESGSYNLEFVADGIVANVQSATPLCEVLGDGSTTYCVPYVFESRKNGCTVCAPGTLFTALREAASRSRSGLPAGSCFRFTPTLSWMLEHGVLADASSEKESTAEHGLDFSTFNPLVQSLMQYDNKFDSNGMHVDVLQTSVSSSKLYSVVDAELVGTAETFPVHGSDDGYFVRGVLAKDPESNSLLASLETREGIQVAETIKDAPDIMMFLAPSADIDEEAQNMTRLGLFVSGSWPEEIAKAIEVEKSARALCELFSLSYDDELLQAQDTICGDLYYVVGVHQLGDAIASKLMGDYLERASRDGKLDGFNMSGLKDLPDILIGIPNLLSDVDKWDPSLLGPCSEFLEKHGVSLGSIVARLDSLDLKLLALQHISEGHATRDKATSEYLAFRQLPGVQSRMRLLENYMVILSALFIQAGQASIIFNCKSHYMKVLRNPITESTISPMKQLLGERTRVKPKDRANLLALSTSVLSRKFTSDSSLLKYFILERNLTSLLGACKSGDRKLFGELKAVCPDESVEKLDRLQAASVFRACRDHLTQVVYDGIAQDATLNSLGKVIAEFDLVCDFPGDILGIDSELEDPVDKWVGLTPDFYNYAGSFLLSYCMVFGESAGDIDSGVSRDLAFAQTPDDFYVGDEDSLLFLRDSQYDITDLHVWDLKGEEQ